MQPYKIETDVPARTPPKPLNIERVKASLAALEVGWGFVIPADELKGEDGRFLSTPIGQRVQSMAKSLGIRVSTTKLPEGLRVRREKDR